MDTKLNLKIWDGDTGEVFYTAENTFYFALDSDGSKLFSPCDRNRAIAEAKTPEGYECYNISLRKKFDLIKAAAIKCGAIETEEQRVAQIELNADWHNHPATQKQLDYLAFLGVKTDGLNITKGRASEMIEIAKTQGVGSLGQDESEGTQYIGEVY